MENNQTPKKQVSHADAIRILRIFGLILFGLLALAIWYISLPIFLGWFTWKKAKWSKKQKSLATAGLVILCLGLIFVASSIYGGNKTDIKAEIAPIQDQQKSAPDIQLTNENTQAVSQTQSQPESNQQSISTQSDASKIDFSLYEDFFNLRNEQFKKLDQLLSGLSTKRRMEILNSDNYKNYPEYTKMYDIMGAFLDFGKKLDKSDPMQKSIAISIDDYANLGGTVLGYQNWLIGNDPDAKSLAELQRKKGDDELNNLLVKLKQKGYTGPGIVSSGLDLKTSTADDEAIFKSSCKKISYKLLEKDPDSYAGEQVYFKGKIDQAGTNGGSDWFRISVTSLGYGIYSDTIWVNTADKTNFVEGDIVSFWGEVSGSKCYQSQMRLDICIPSIDAKYISK